MSSIGDNARIKGYIHRAGNDGPVIAHSEQTFISVVYNYNSNCFGKPYNQPEFQVDEVLIPEIPGPPHTSTRVELSGTALHSLSPEMRDHLKTLSKRSQRDSPIVRENNDEQNSPRALFFTTGLLSSLIDSIMYMHDHPY